MTLSPGEVESYVDPNQQRRVASRGRAVGMERELAGYSEYARRVRYRLVPGLW